MLLYRIDRQHRRDQVLSGRGAELYGGRWNLPGVAAVYTATSRSLSILEMLVHLDLRQHLPKDRIMITIEIPDHWVETLNPETLGKHWSQWPYHLDSQKVFGAFVQSQPEKLALAVPSAMVPEEQNVIIDPRLAHQKEAQVIDIRDLDMDQRLASY